MKKFAVLSCFIFVFSSVCIAASERDPNEPPLEGAILSPVGAFGDAIQYVVELSDNILCGVSQGRLKTFSKDNVEDVISSYWIPYQNPRIFEYYEGYIYLVQGSAGIYIFDVTEPQKIRLAGILDIIVSYFAGIEIKENRLFLVDELDKSLVVLSLESPVEPREIFRHRLPEAVRTGTQVSIVGDKIYVSCLDGLVIFSAQDLSKPELLGMIYVDSEASLGPLIVKDNYAYVYAGGEIRIFDISIPDAIEYKIAIKVSWSSHAVLRDNHFIGFGRGGIYIYDLSSPLSPELVRREYNGLPGNFLIGKSQDYVVNDDGKAEPLNGLPYFSGNMSRFGFKADNLIIHKEYAYVFGSDRLWVLDISRPWDPRYVSEITMYHGSPDTVFIDGDYIYTPRYIFDISHLTEPAIIKRLDGGTCVAIKEIYLLYIKPNGLDIYDVLIPSNAALIKNIPLEEEFNKIFVHNDIIYLGTREGKLRSCQLENDLTLTTLDEIELAVTDRGLIMDLCGENDFLYVALNGDGIASVDIEDPYNMQIYARFNTFYYTRQIKVFNAYAYVANGSGGILVVDMLTKGYEKKVASYPASDWSTKAIAISDSYVYTCEDRNGVAIFVSNLLNPK